MLYLFYFVVGQVQTFQNQNWKKQNKNKNKQTNKTNKTIENAKTQTNK